MASDLFVLYNLLRRLMTRKLLHMKASFSWASGKILWVAFLDVDSIAQQYKIRS
jgi:hypothetical protein